MSLTTERPARAVLFNVPNQLTALRLVLSLVLFVMVAYKTYLAGLVVFLIAASTDWLDGYVARKYGMVTTLGRILDPFVDKIIICGTFVYLVGVPESDSLLVQTLRPWMVVVIIGRELLVTALRSFLEGEGADFSATLSGKLKMLLQCIAAGVCLFYLSYGRASDFPLWLEWLMRVSVWSAVAITIISGLAYVQRAVAILSK
ncbi:MAG: CDP-diacylglycerol--glycerol-3-phosphate 3-phosphatidyltransferase [Planctomycetes bacterium]|nr:CDP-diacylglycerol--glycerol-3-phosphate 3-phosphatidyltransferase [Planctomycetota bacterium]